MTAAVRRRPLRRAAVVLPASVVELPLYRTRVTAGMPWPLSVYVKRRPPAALLLKSDGAAIEVRPGDKIRIEIAINTRGIATLEIYGDVSARQKPLRRP